MVVLIIINIVLVTFLVIYLLKNKKDNEVAKSVCVNNKHVEVKRVEHKRNKEINPDRVFVGRFITDEEYQQMMSNRKSDISILLKEVEREYEHLKQLNNERTEGNNSR